MDGNAIHACASRARSSRTTTRNEGGGAIFFVSNNRTGTMRIEDSTLQRNPSDGFETRGFPGIFFLGARNPSVVASKLG